MFICDIMLVFYYDKNVCFSVDAMHLSHKSEIVPSLKYKRRFLNVNLHELRNNFTHVVVKVPTTIEPVSHYD